MTSHGIVPRVLSNHCDALLRNGVPALLAAFNRFRGGGFWSWPRSARPTLASSTAGGCVGRLTQQRFTINQSVTSSRKDLDEIVVSFFFFFYTLHCWSTKNEVMCNRRPLSLLVFGFGPMRVLFILPYILIIVVFLHVSVAVQPSVVAKCR